MIVFILTMWLYASDTPLVIGGYTTLAKCEAERPALDTDYSWGICQSLEIK